ncbi:MAG: peptidylprolyl isomerase [Clostridiaceae bacterium]|nr:peptidylprolyl isomerase [Clostridiaceae bacterium]
MENKQEKTAAELYREERKQRMAKAAKKNAKKSPQLHKVGKMFGKCLLVVIIAALCLSIVYACMSFTGVLQRNVLSALKLGNKRVSVAEYNYYYLSMFNQYYSYASQYENYYGAGSGKTYTGFDYTVSPSQQSYSGEVEGVENPTWADYFKSMATQQIQIIHAYSDYGRAAGLTLTEAQQEEINTAMEDYRSKAKSSDYSLNRYLDAVCGKGVNEKLLLTILENTYIAQSYDEKLTKDNANSITDEQIAKEFEDNKKNYTTFSIGIYEIKADVAETEEGASEEEVAAAKTAAMQEAKTKAEAALATINSTDTLVAAAAAYDSSLTSDTVISNDITATNIESYVPDAVEWIYSADRAVGDKQIFEVSDGYYIIYLIELPTRDTTKGVNVRHILVKFEDKTDEQGNAIELTDEEKATYYAKAQEIYELYKADPTEENFAKLATEKTEDTGSAENGGLYESVYPGDMVTEFNDWIFDAARQPGDTDIIETTYGYHIMYFVGNDNAEKWASDVKKAIESNLSESDFNAAKSDAAYTIKANEPVINWATEKINKMITERNVSSSAS